MRHLKYIRRTHDDAFFAGIASIRIDINQIDLIISQYFRHNLSFIGAGLKCERPPLNRLNIERPTFFFWYLADKKQLSAMPLALCPLLLALSALIFRNRPAKSGHRIFNRVIIDAKRDTKIAGSVKTAAGNHQNSLLF
jgi:hypothetical protein